MSDSVFRFEGGVMLMSEGASDLPGPLGPLTTETESKVLRADFPDRAYKPYQNKADLVDLKAGFIYDRLLEAYGDGHVRIRGNYAYPVKHKDQEYVVFTGYLDVLGETRPVDDETSSRPFIRFSIPLSGAWKVGAPQDLGDAMKSVVTNALSKAANTHLGVASDLFKGLIEIRGGKVLKSNEDDAPAGAPQRGLENAGKGDQEVRDAVMDWGIKNAKLGGRDKIKSWWSARYPKAGEAPLLKDLTDADLKSFHEEVVRRV